MADLAAERMNQLLDRYVGFERFDAERAHFVRLLPGKMYVAQHGRFVLLGFHETAEADKFFDDAMKATL
jgi:hypothetical protein